MVAQDKDYPLSEQGIGELRTYIESIGYMAPSLLEKELDWFFNDLGINDYYFKTTSPQDMGRHLLTLSASRLISSQSGEGHGIQINSQSEDEKTIIVEDIPSRQIDLLKKIETTIDNDRFEMYKTRKESQGDRFSFYILKAPSFAEEGNNSFESHCPKGFLDRSQKMTIERYRKLWKDLQGAVVPQTVLSQEAEEEETRLMIGFPHQGESRFLSLFYHFISLKKLNLNRMYKEPFRDGKQIYSFYFADQIKDFSEDFLSELTALLQMPKSKIEELFINEELNAQEVLYALSASAFAHQFLKSKESESDLILEALRDQPDAQGVFQDMSKDLLKNTYSSSRISQTIIENSKVIKTLYSHFKSRFTYRDESDSKTYKRREDEAYQRVLRDIDRDIAYSKDRYIFKAFLQFNLSVLKTNFFKERYAALAFRLDPSFLDNKEYEETPFGIFLMVGKTFIGFHIRFRDIARGGVRLIQSKNRDAYAHNLDTLFNENYDLAYTQQKKNKDIPEGGSKGTILLNYSSQKAKESSFKAYVDALLDLINFDNDNCSVNNRIQDYYKEKELLFLGPDEGTAELMDWASSHAKSRLYPFWKSISTGKSPLRGGIPHDIDGMTTRGVHQYVLGVLDKLGLKESSISKMQTGGPDGDLGSNEILISKDKTCSIVDGSGVIYDPDGLNRGELERLAKKRVCVDSFNKDLLSKDGFFVSVDDRDITLPSGEKVPNGETFRNTFHLHPLSSCDLFVPCGGRPGAINISNWKSLLDENGKPRIPIIVEGANLFLTEPARINLERKGVYIFKDASTNKGGVTSSSFEVTAALSLSDSEFEELMIVKSGGYSSFRETYIKQIIERVEENAQREFNLLWNENQKSHTPYTQLTNEVSAAVNRITDKITLSGLAKSPALQSAILPRICLPILVETLGLQEIEQRIPKPYLEAMVASYTAADYIYTYGLEANEVEFFNYMNHLIH